MGEYAAKAIIFDLDGTLVDSAEDLRASLNVILDDLRLRPIEAGEIRSMIGDGVPKLVERALILTGGDLGQKNALVTRFLRIYETNAAVLTRCYPGVVETLDALRARQFRLAVVTNKPFIATEKILRSLSLADFFSAVIGGDSVPQRKPHPAPLLEAGRRLAIDPADLIMVGDNIHDVEAARAAGIRSIAVTYGYHHQPPSTFQADHLIDRFNELLALVVNPTSHRHNTGTGADRETVVRLALAAQELRQ